MNNSFPQEKKLIKLLSKDANKFINNLLTDRLEFYSGEEVQVYPNLIHILIDNFDHYNPINDVVKKPDYFKALNEYQNFKFQYLPKAKPSRAIINFNQKFVNDKFIIASESRYNKAINKYFHKKITANVVIFNIQITFTNFNRMGRIKNLPDHRAFLLYNTKIKSGVYIDPQHIATQELVSYDTYKDALIGNRKIQKTYGSEDFDSIVINKLNKILSNIVKDKVDIQYINHICPQAITKDKNCVFWSLYLIELYVQEYITDSNINFESVMYNFLKENPSKEDLFYIIEDYKNELASLYIQNRRTSRFYYMY
jgi:hypothetical protein